MKLPLYLIQVQCYWFFPFLQPWYLLIQTGFLWNFTVALSMPIGRTSTRMYPEYVRFGSGVGSWWDTPGVMKEVHGYGILLQTWGWTPPWLIPLIGGLAPLNGDFCLRRVATRIPVDMGYLVHFNNQTTIKKLFGEGKGDQWAYFCKFRSFFRNFLSEYIFANGHFLKISRDFIFANFRGGRKFNDFAVIKFRGIARISPNFAV